VVGTLMQFSSTLRLTKLTLLASSPEEVDFKSSELIAQAQARSAYKKSLNKKSLPVSETVLLCKPWLPALQQVVPPIG
jgi:hypothetical protein